MKYAINIMDLTVDEILSRWLIAPVIPSRITVKAEPKYLDGGAVLLECNEEQANGIISVIRIRHPKHKFRCYQSKTGKGGWKRI